MSARQRTAFVTGAARGLGRSCCEALSRDGFVVAVTDIDEDLARATAAELGEGAFSLRCDVTDTLSVNDAVAAAASRTGGLDVLVNNAGVIGPEPSAHVSDEAWFRLIDVHLHGLIRCARAAYPHLLTANAAAIVNIASVAAHIGIPGRASYSAAKAGIEGVTRSLAVEWAADGIRVNAVAPGYVRTALVEAAIANGTVDRTVLLGRVPLARLGEPAEIAAVVSFLASPAAGFVTGQVMVADGGLTINGAW